MGSNSEEWYRSWTPVARKKFNDERTRRAAAGRERKTLERENAWLALPSTTQETIIKNKRKTGRTLTPLQRLKSATMAYSNSSSGHRNVSLHAASGLWFAHTQVAGKQIKKYARTLAEAVVIAERLRSEAHTVREQLRDKKRQERGARPPREALR